MRTLLSVLSSVVLLVLSCSFAQAAEDAAKTVKVANDVSCGACLFEMEGVKGCPLAVKIDGKAYLVTGVKIDMHKNKLCSTVRKAHVEGAVKDGKFVATSVKLVPVAKAP